MLEFLIANHCAPALAGIKPSNIVSCQKSDTALIRRELNILNKQLNTKDIYAEFVAESKDNVLIMVYRKKALENHLANSKNNAFLKRYGYAGSKNLSDYLERLKFRLAKEDFPHEIGVFLGYPLRDIHCFINHKNDGCILTGDWKVYHNAEEAKKIFARYKACKAAVSKKISDGKTLAQIFCAA